MMKGLLTVFLGSVKNICIFFHFRFLKYIFTVFENQRKSLIQNCERSELHFHFEWTKNHKKLLIWASFWKPDIAVKKCYQTGPFYGKLVKNAKTKMRYLESHQNWILTPKIIIFMFVWLFENIWILAQKPVKI